MDGNKCKICSSTAILFFNEMVLEKYDVHYFYCQHCEFIQTETPYWLEEAYQRPINLSDTGIVARNIEFSNFTSVLISLFLDDELKFLDYAGGNGLFVRLMRDKGYDFCWDDLFCANIFANGFEFSKVDYQKKIELVTCFEAFEHFNNPMLEITKLLEISDNILFSTELQPVNKPKPREWNYYGFHHGQHISFYSLKTLNEISDKFKLNICSTGKIHFLSRKKFSNRIFNYMYLLSKSSFFRELIRRNSLTMQDSLFMEKIINQ